MIHEQTVMVMWRNGGEYVERLVSDKPITMDQITAHYEAQGMDWERDSITFVDPIETVELGG